MRAAIYARISKDQREGEGVGNQEAACRALAERRGLEVVAVYIDNDISASRYTRRVRPEYQRMLAAVEDGSVEVVLCWSQDRLIRQPKELETYIDLCRPRNVKTFTVASGDVDLATATGMQNARIVGAVAAGESDRTSERIRAQKQAARVKGKLLGGPVPHGWTHGDEPGTYVADPKVAPLIAEATEMVARGESLAEVARWARAQGMRGRILPSQLEAMKQPGWERPGTWDELGPVMSASTLRNILLRPLNIGVQEFKGTPYPSPYPAIVDEDDYAACLDALRAKRGAAPGGGKVKSLLTGVVFCWCGRHMVKRRPTMYGCTAARPGGRTVPGHAWKTARPLEEYVLGYVVAYLAGPDVSQAVVDAARVPGEKTAVQEARDQLEKLQERKRALVRLFAAGAIAEAQLVEGTAELDRGIKGVDVALAAVTTDRKVARVLRAASPVDAFMAASDDVKRLLIGELFRVELVHPGKHGGGPFRADSVRIEPRGVAA